MPLRPELDYTVPELTARIARRSFPKGTPCMRIYDELGSIFRDQDFADLFPRRGQPAAAPFRLALVTILQFLEGLSDRAAADAVRVRIDWKYLLCLEVDDPGFDSTVLVEFRDRLLEGEAERRLFDHVLTALCERKLVKARGRQRTDSTHVLSAVRSLHRLERAVETLRATLNVLATVAPEWVRRNVPLEWITRYGKRAEESRFPDADAERAAFFDAVGADGDLWLSMLWSERAPEWMRQLPAVETLRVVWLQNFEVIDGSVRRRAKDNQPPSARQIESPYDTQARYARKSETTWVGYKVHVTEACDEEGPHVITNVHTDEALRGDNDALPLIHEDLSRVELLPDRHVVDTGYVEAKRLVESRRDYGVELFGPTPGNRFWQSAQGKGFDLSCFEIDWEGEQAKCPEGKTSSSWRPGEDARGNTIINIVFAKSDCSVCPSLARCTTAKTKRRTINVKPRALQEALHAARAREKTEEFKQGYKVRAGIEGTISEGVRALGLRRSRYIGMAKARLQHLATKAAINLIRAYAWFNDVAPAKTRKSAFVRAMEPLAA